MNSLINSSNSIKVRNMFSGLAKNYDLVHTLASFGFLGPCRRALARRIKILSPLGQCLDVASGTGEQIIATRKMHPWLPVTGLDFSAAMLAVATPKVRALGLPRVALTCADALNMPFSGDSFDSISLSFGLRNIETRLDFYKEALRVLNPGGRLLILEFYHDPKSKVHLFTDFYLRYGIPSLAAFISHEKNAYKYLASSVFDFPQPQTLAKEMIASGFNKVSFRTFNFDTVMLMWGEKAAC
ncbi:MAG: ubiquinone/menaquinone biosynthesis methyltransferase [Candidatus Adiutrix sp.]